MARLGRFYPNSKMNDWAWKWQDFYFAPRNVRVRFDGASAGTLTIPWRNTDNISTVAERDLSTDFIKWVVTDPEIPDDELWVKWRFYNTMPAVVTVSPWKIELSIEYYHLGTKMADRIAVAAGTAMVDTTTFEMKFFAQWQNLTDPAQWDRTTNCHIYACKWSELPDYHPYRH